MCTISLDKREEYIHTRQFLLLKSLPGPVNSNLWVEAGVYVEHPSPAMAESGTSAFGYVYVLSWGDRVVMCYAGKFRRKVV